MLEAQYLRRREKEILSLGGKAADIQVRGVKPSDVYSFLTNRFPGQYGFGLYEEKGFVHVDSGDRVWRCKKIT